LSLPASIAGQDLVVSMAGTATQTGSTVRFEQTVDSFVRDLSFSIVGTTLQVQNQQAGSAAFTITLTRD
jgi:hypothetical protein